jgi:hypothetical protein
MKYLPFHTVIALALFIASASLSASEDSDDILFKFDGGIGSQPLRSGSVINSVSGVNPGGAPWVIGSLKVDIKASGKITAKIKGVLLGGTDNIGTRGGPRKMVISLFCRNATAPVPPAVARTLETVPYNSEFADLDGNGDFQISGSLTNASGATPPADCGDKIDNRPVLLIRTVSSEGTPGSWFAAGILKN